MHLMTLPGIRTANNLLLWRKETLKQLFKIKWIYNLIKFTYIFYVSGFIAVSC